MKPIPLEVYDYINDFIEKGDYEYAYNIRVYEQDDKEGIALYLEQKNDGCCGFVDDREVVVNGKTYVFGFNYGH